jgi:predicted acylesterase/phospholipase RssA
MNILVLQGGGIRGVVDGRLLERIDKACPGFMKHVDVIAGTSTGGIQALKLASGGKVTDLVALYEKRGKDIFRSRDILDVVPNSVRLVVLVLALGVAGVLLALRYKFAALVTLCAFLAGVVLLNVVAKLDELFRADYSHEHFEQVLKDELGHDKTLRDCDKIVLIPTFDMRTWKPKFFDNFPGEQRDLDQKLWEIARCTSAAPTYWPSHQWCLDGGLFANNPSDSAVASALRYLRRKHLMEDPDLNDPDALGAMKDNVEILLGEPVLLEEVAEIVATTRAMGKISVLSLGTGDVPHQAPKKPRNDAGILQVIPMLLNVVMDGGVDSSAFRTRQVLGKHRHVRIQPKLPSVVDLADVEAIPELVQIADLTDIEPAVKLIRERWMAGMAHSGENAL